MTAADHNVNTLKVAFPPLIVSARRDGDGILFVITSGGTPERVQLRLTQAELAADAGALLAAWLARP